jgi:hypothetical protein
MELISKNFKYAENDDRQFALKISILNALSYIVIVLSVTYVDSHIHHLTHGLRNYPLGYSVGWISILIFILTFMIHSKKDREIFNSAKTKAILTFLVVVATNVFLNYKYFPPEFPHAIIVFGSIMYEMIIFFIVYIRNFELKFNFLLNRHIDKNAKIERIKLEYDIWKNFFFVLIAGFSGWILVWLQGVRDVGEMVTTSSAEQELVRTHIIFLTSFGSFLGILLFSEVAKKILIIRNQLDKIRR